MLLSKTTPTSLVVIHYPIWNNGLRQVGIRSWNLSNHIEVVIDYTNKQGERLYPQALYIDRLKLETYPLKQLKNYPNRYVYIVPVKDLEVLERG